MPATWFADQQRSLHYRAAVFRLLLDALARPGTIVQLPTPDALFALHTLPALPIAPNAFAIGALLTLLDREVSFCLSAMEEHEIGGESKLAQWISLHTGAHLEQPDRATFALFLERANGELLGRLHQGTLAEPEASATAFISVESLSIDAQGDDEADVFELRGPGIREAQRVAIIGLPTSTLAAIVATRQDYPLGVDAYLVDTTGKCMGLPRTTRITTLEQREG